MSTIDRDGLNGAKRAATWSALERMRETAANRSGWCDGPGERRTGEAGAFQAWVGERAPVSNGLLILAVLALCGALGVAAGLTLAILRGGAL